MTSIKKNFIYNILYQLLILILPLITVPYVSRVLGSSGVGIYSYTYSIVNYFMLIAMLGINNYGNRTIAKVRDDKEKLSKTFFSIYSIQIIMSILMILLYIGYVLLFDNQYKVIALIQLIYLISNMLDINWFFFGLEKFKLTVTRSTLVKIISLILIFIFVKEGNDVSKYTLILSGSTLLSQLLLFPFLKNEIKFIRIKLSDIKKHIKPCLTLFVPVIAISLYKVMDKIMLGNMAIINEVGYYEQAEKIIGIPLGIITALGTVMLPRMSNLVAKKDDSKVKEYINKSINFMMFLAFPICFGLIAISNDFIPIFLGQSFNKTSILIYYLSITLIFLSFANVIRTQYLIPKEKDKVYIISVSLGAVINLIGNFILIPRLQSIGACISTILAEFTVMLYQIIAVRKELPIKKYLKEITVFLVTSIIMFMILIIFKRIDINVYIKIITQIILGILIYFAFNIKYINSIINLKKLFSRNNILTILSLLITLIYIAIILITSYFIFKLNIIPDKYLIIGYIILFIITIILIFNILNKKKYINKMISSILMMIISIVLLISCKYINTTSTFIENTQVNKDVLVYNVIVKKDSSFNNIQDLNNKFISYINDDYTNSVTKKLESIIKYDKNITSSTNILYYLFENDTVDAIVLEQGFITMASEEIDNFLDNTKIIYTFEVEIDSYKKEEIINVKDDPFVLYISGIDQYGSVSSVRGRSDVNQLLIINPKTNKILIVNTPRDYYVQLAGTTGLKDKLTHAGVYGIEKSIKTLENLYGVDINHYIRVNFDTLIKVIDIIGGIEIDSDKEFICHTNKSVHVKKGINNFNGKEALAYSRERYAYITGDNHRGANQQQVITAIIEKVTKSNTLLSKYNSILNSLNNTFQTDMSTNLITSFIKYQLDENPNWNIESIAVVGSGSMDYTYSYGTRQKLWVMEVDWNSVYIAREKIEQILN